MTTDRTERFELPLRALAIPLLPLLVLALGSWFVSRYGLPIDYLAQPLLRDGHAEAAGRLKVLATFVLLTAAGGAALLYAADGLRLLGRRSAGLLAAAYVVGALAGTAFMTSGTFQDGEKFIGEPLVCGALSLLDGAPAPNDSAVPAQRPSPAPPRAHGHAPGPANCQGANVVALRTLSAFQRHFIALVMPALILGMISCLAMPRRPSEPACELQTRRLNVHLYLAAAIMVSNLLFLSAVLRWPGYALHPSDLPAFTAHISSLVLYWGVVYSLFIASFYLPVAAGLFGTYNQSAGAADCPPGEAAQESDAAAFFRPLRLMATMAAPALIGLLGEIVHL